MTLRELGYLVALADYGHFGRAAEACHVSQPTLSTQLMKLEEFLGVTLFERTNKTLLITPIGEQIVARARRVLAEADSIVDLARHQAGPLSAPLNLGVIPTLSPYLLPWMLPAVKASYPDLRLIIHEDLTDNLMERLRAHRIDGAMIALPIEDDGDLEIAPLFDEPFFLACPREHPLAKSRAVRQSDLRKEHLLLLTDGHCLRDQALAVCGFAEPPAQDEGTDFRASSLETIRQMVAAGMGCTLLPAMALGDDEQHMAFRPLADKASRRIGLIWRKSYPKTADLELLASLVRRSLPRSVRAVRLNNNS